MSLSLLFWMLYILTILFGGWSYYEPAQPLWFRRAGAFLVVWVLIGILGWKVFGPALHP